MTPFYGFPLPIPSRTAQQVAVAEPTLGFDSSQPPADLVPGQSPSFENLLLRDGGMEPRPMLTLRTTNPQPMGPIAISGGLEVVDVTGTRYPVVSGTTRLAWYSNTSWSVLSYVSSFGLSSPPAANAGDYFDFTQIYYPRADENLAMAAHDSYDTLLCWQAGTTVFSNMTGAPRARRVTALDNFVLAGNLRSGGSDYVQRVQWSDRGDPSNWTGGLSGFEDLMDMRGQITRLVTHDNAVIVFSDEEIWKGLRSNFPNTFVFTPYDRSVGCPYPWTATQTPLGVMFLAKDYQIYLLPRGGGGAVPIGQRLQPSVRNVLDHPTRAFGVYDKVTGHYQFTYPIRGGSGYPQRAAWLNIATGAWAPQTYDAIGGAVSLTRGFEITVTSAATTWDGWLIPWDTETLTWDELGGASEDRAVLMGSSTGTLFYLSSNATNDNGVVCRSRWRSGALAPADADPARMQTVTRVDVRYSATAASNLTLRFSTDQGMNFDAGQRLALGPVSTESAARVDAYVAAYHPTLELVSEGVRGWRVFGFQVTMRQGGR